MSDRTLTTVVLSLARPWQPATAAHAVARSIVAEPPRAPWFGVPGMRGDASPGEPPRASPGAQPRADLWATLRAAWRRQRTRRCLVELDARTLKDIGVSYAEAEAEANKPFWVR